MSCWICDFKTCFGGCGIEPPAQMTEQIELFEVQIWPKN